MQHHILVYGDSLTWGIVPETRRRLPFERRWPGVLEGELVRGRHSVRVTEDCLNGRRTVFEDPFKPGRNGMAGLEQRIEAHSPLALVLLMLGSNDLQSVHQYDAGHAAQGVGALVGAIRRAPIEPGMPVPRVLVIAPPVPREALGSMTGKFVGAASKSAGLAEAYQQVAGELGCPFFDAGRVASVSPLDGVHLDQGQHELLGRALAPVVLRILNG